MEAIWLWFAEPLQYEFIRKAILVSAIVGVVCSALSCYITLKGWSLMGDAVSHSVLPGVVLSYIVNAPFSIGAFIFGLGSAIGIGFVKSQTRIKEDASMGIVFTGCFALGLVLISKTPSNIDLQHILFGNVLGISNEDMLQTFIISGITLVTIIVLRKDLLLFCFDPTHARSIGLNTQFLNYMLLALLSLTIVAAQQTAGITLVVAMLITPGATAYLLTDRFDWMLGIAVGIGVFSSVIGTYLSYHFDGSTGGSIVLLMTLFFIVTMVFAPKHGLLRRALRLQQAKKPVPGVVQSIS
ncbi:metal ABC transporter permease [Candidatus Cyanaurora vandensis]|uniref:metal ABC transporter permease n=1 Tax=Candidatus Cyanaurora vandensis TaxID=2714958 RepID=UPI002579B7B7|nr:metal ABC transporter permease [Candidatus Cyanaurora vandensis]